MNDQASIVRTIDAFCNCRHFALRHLFDFNVSTDLFLCKCVRSAEYQDGKEQKCYSVLHCLSPHEEFGVSAVLADVVLYNTDEEEYPVNERNHSEDSPEGEGIEYPHKWPGAHIVAMDSESAEEGAEEE